MGRRLVAALVVLAALAPTASAVGAPSRHVYVRDGTSVRWLVAPKRMHIVDGEGSSSFAEALRWHGWGRGSATARGRIAVCFTRCAGDMQYRRYGVRLVASKLGMCRQHFAYRMLVFSWHVGAHMKSTVLRPC